MIILNIFIIDEFLHGWCPFLQYFLLKKLSLISKIIPEAWEIWERTPETLETNNSFWNDHQIIKYRDIYIDVRGIFTEEEIIKAHKEEFVKSTITKRNKQPKYTIDQIDCYLDRTNIDNNINNKKKIHL